MLRAVYQGQVLAEAPRTGRVEFNHYFQPNSLRREHFSDSATKTLCFWKGIAHYYNLVTDEGIEPDAAWYYPKPSPLARSIKNHVAFGPDVRIEGQPEERAPGLVDKLRAMLGRTQ